MEVSIRVTARRISSHMFDSIYEASKTDFTLLGRLMGFTTLIDYHLPVA